VGFKKHLTRIFVNPLRSAMERYQGLDAECLSMGAAAAAAIFAITMFLGFPALLNLGLTIATAIGLPIFVAKRRLDLFRKAFDYSLVDALTTISASLKAGLPLIDALENAAHNSDPAFGSVAADLVKNYRFGVPIEVALDKARKRIGTQNANISFGAMIIATELGGNLPEILRRIVGTIRERQRVEGKLQSLTAQGRTQAALLMAAPPAFGFFMYLWDPTRTKLLVETGTGQILLSIAVVLEIVGILVTKKVMKLDI
jgi:tight adherence protein B